jgi:glyoxylase-like metal-dependent hydrolase (beta-lactamase superfamily II)
MSPAAGDRIRVRMYRVGFGDCFLLSLPGDRHVLVDCGVHSRGNIGTLDDVVADIARVTRRRLAAIVVSHAHEDHIAGFLRAEAEFRSFTIGAIWLPWTENPDDALARALGRRHAALYETLVAYLAARPGAREAEAVLANAAAARGRNARALDNLRAGFGTGARVRYLERGDRLDDAEGIAGLSVRFLGPPRDEAFLRKLNPPKAERYLRLGVDGTPSWVDVLEPFGPAASSGGDHGGPVLSEGQRRALREAVELSPDALAFALDQALNNTSLVCLFSYRGRSLLFPGDAQYGSWKGWLDDDNVAELLRGVSFYKVAHHGSENATPKTALERMTPGGFAAMLSTQGHPWPSIPYDKLMAALERQTNRQVIRSDSLPLPGAPAGPEVARLPRGFTRGRFWIDYRLPL